MAGKGKSASSATHAAAGETAISIPRGCSGMGSLSGLMGIPDPPGENLSGSTGRKTYCKRTAPPGYGAGHNFRQVLRRVKGDRMQKFIVGQEYSTRSACDYNCIFRFRVTKRTEKSIWIAEHDDAPRMRRVEIYDGMETIYPYGKYSMAPILRA